MEQKFNVKLQQFLILVSFWRNQSVFAQAGKTEEEKLGFAFPKRRETISAVNPEQKVLLDILAEGNGEVEERLSEVWEKITWKFVEISSVAKEEIDQNSVLWTEIFSLIYPHVQNREYKDMLIRLALSASFSMNDWRRLRDAINSTGDYCIAMLFEEKVELLQLDK